MTSRTRRRADRLTPSQARAARRARRQTRRRLIRIGAVTVVGIVALLFILSLFAPNVASILPTNSITEDGLWERIADQGNTHVNPGEGHPPYNSVPATSGWHYPQPFAPARWGIHDQALPDEVLAHNLEHGGVGIHYDCPDGCPELVDQLGDIARRARRVVLSPYPGMDTAIALTAWSFIDKFDEYDQERIEDFVNAHLDSGSAPESGAR